MPSTRDCLEPLQTWRAASALGIEKPWAPPRSYGLLARLDADGEVVETLHSRVGGKNHGITAAIETAQGVVIVSKGSGRVLLQQAGAQQMNEMTVLDRHGRKRRRTRRCASRC